MSTKIRTVNGPIVTEHPALVWSTCYAQRVKHIVEDGKHTFYRDDGERVVMQSNGYELSGNWEIAPPGSDAPLKTDPLVVGQAVCLFLLRQSWWRPIKGWDEFALEWIRTGIYDSAARAAARAAAWAAAEGAADAAEGAAARAAAWAAAEGAADAAAGAKAHQEIAACVSEVESWEDNPEGREKVIAVLKAHLNAKGMK